MNTDKNRAMMITSIFRIKQIQHLFNFPRMVSAFDYGELHDLIANFCIFLIAKLLSRRKKNNTTK